MAHPSSNDGDDGTGQRDWTKKWSALRHFALDRAADDEKHMDTFSLWDNGNVSNDWAFRKKVDDLGKKVDDHGASCLGCPCEPGMPADVVGRVVSRPAVESDCESGSKGSTCLDTRTEMAQHSCRPCGKRR